MKLLLVTALCGLIGIAVTIDPPIEGNGQPGCRTQEEINVRFYRNFWDPTVYWECVRFNQSAVRRRCPDQTGFVNSIKDCVGWDVWVWEPYVAPPSYAYNLTQFK